MIGSVIGLSSIFCLKPALVSTRHTRHKLVDIIPGGITSALVSRYQQVTKAYQSSKTPVLRPTTTAYHLVLLAPGVETRRDGVCGSGRSGVKREELGEVGGMKILPRSVDTLAVVLWILLFNYFPWPFYLLSLRFFIICNSPTFLPYYMGL
jgi:hypothetical protein